MTRPIGVGYIVSRILDKASSVLAENDTEYFQVVAAIHAGDKSKAIELLERITNRNSTVSRALFLIRADAIKEAGELLQDLADRPALKPKN